MKISKYSICIKCGELNSKKCAICESCLAPIPDLNVKPHRPSHNYLGPDYLKHVQHINCRCSINLHGNIFKEEE